MKRFFKTLTLLVVILFLLVSGVDTALDCITRTPTENSFTVYNESGTVVLAYNGDLNNCKTLVKSGITMPSFRFLHRT